jgi:kynurenine formamidase
MPALPDEATLVGWFDSLSNWGRWGEDDRLGTLNLITPEVRVAAAGLVTTGRTVSMSRELDPEQPDPLGRGSVLQRYMMLYEQHDYGPGARFKGCREFIGIVPHGSATHLDALSHVMWDDRMYNGVPAGAVTSIEGATEHDVTSVSDGVITRGVLLDIPALRGERWLGPGELVFPEELEAAEARQGVRVREGDALALHTGNFRRIAEEGLHPDNHAPGYAAACLPWFRERGVALITSDGINDAQPAGYGGPSLGLPVHAVGIVAMGLWLLDNSALDELAGACAELGRWEFLFSMAPLKLLGSTSSPVNPIAVF